MIKLEYQRMHPVLQRATAPGGPGARSNEMAHQLKESVFRMTQQRESLKETTES